MSRAPQPPRLWRGLLRLCLRGDAYEAIAGDLAEEFAVRAAPPTVRRAARHWYRRQAVNSITARYFPRTPKASPPPRSTRPMQDLRLDLKFALRSFVRSPGVAAVIVITLALGVGATTSIFSILDATLLRPLPYTEPGQLVSLYEENLGRGFTFNQVSPANFLSWRERAESYRDVTAHGWTTGWALSRDGRAEWVRGNQVFFNFFETMGATPALGRGFREAENWESSDSVVISHGLWQRAFGADPSVVGDIIELDGRDRIIVGVAPEGFSYPEPGLDIWRPMRWDRDNTNAPWFRRAHYIRVVGRLADGVTVAEADAELRTVARALEAEFPDTNEDFAAGAISLRDWVVGDTYRYLLILAGSAAAVLLIACANIASLLIARASVRAQEMAIRSALGAGRLRIARQLLTESLLLAVVGGALGVLVSTLMTRAILQLAAEAIPRAHEVTIDWRILAFAATVTMLTGIAFGLAPALRLAQAAASSAGERTATGAPGKVRGRQVLVVAEVALAVVLVAGAGLMLRSLLHLQRVDPGFEPANLLAAEIEVPSARYPDAAARMAFLDGLTAGLEAAPGFTAVGMADALPLEGSNWTSDFQVEGRELQRDEGAVVEFNRRIVDATYFDVMSVPVLQGRGFTTLDGPDSMPVIVINDVLARRYFGGADPVGSRIRFSDEDDDPWFTVVGVVGSTKVEGLDSREWPEILMPAAQNPLFRATLLVRYEPGTAQPGTLFREELRRHDPLMPVIRLERYEQIVARTLVDERLTATLLTAFGGLALLLAVVGIYGVFAYTVARQTREIGIRMALGASAPVVRAMVVRRAAAMLAVGLALGLGLYLLASSFLRTVLFEISATDPTTLAIVLAVLATAGMVAAWVPARRASRVDPLTSLRAD